MIAIHKEPHPMYNTTKTRELVILHDQKPHLVFLDDHYDCKYCIVLSGNRKSSTMYNKRFILLKEKTI